MHNLQSLSNNTGLIFLEIDLFFWAHVEIGPCIDINIIIYRTAIVLYRPFGRTRLMVKVSLNHA
jgi:hypothetical protein